MNALKRKFLEVLYSVLPITFIVLILNFTYLSLDFSVIIRFLLASVMVVIGLSLFLIGVDIGVSVLGNKVGETITKTNKISIILIVGLIFGFIISIAEPGLVIFTNQTASVTDNQISSSTLLIVASLGIGIFLMIAFIRIIYNIPLYILLFIFYSIIFMLGIFSNPELLVIAFDASGATTGVLAVPFILALAFGISRMKKDSKASEKDSFGTIAIVSVGAVISVLILGLFNKNQNLTPAISELPILETRIFYPFFVQFNSIAKQSILAILPIFAIYLLFQFLIFKLSKRAFVKIFKGFIYSFVGLLIFLLAVNAGFMDIGRLIGYFLAHNDYQVIVVIVGFTLGIVTILAEPAVHVLTHQIENVTTGYISKSSVLVALSLGVGIAVGLSVMRLFNPAIKIWYILLIGYLIALGLMFIVPKIFVGIAFDAGGVATGPLTATFILAYVIGVANGTESSNVILDSFGMISLVALTPIITLQLLGLVFKIKAKKGGL